MIATDAPIRVIRGEFSGEPLVIVDCPSLAPIWRESGVSWRIYGKQGTINCIHRKSQTISKWSRIFGGLPYSPFASDIWACIVERVEDCFDVKIKKVCSVGTVARVILQRVIGDAWRPTCGRSGKMVRAAKRGARIQCFRHTGDGPCTLAEVDLPGAYPTAGMFLLPWYAPYKLSPSAPKTGDIELWEVEIKGPDRYINPLPDYDWGAGKVCYPSGRWKGVYWLRELELLDRLEGWSYWPTKRLAFPAYSGLSATMGAMKHLRESDPMLAKYWKSLAVASIGVLAQRSSPQQIIQKQRPEVGDVPVSLRDGLYLVRKEGASRPATWNREQIASYVWMSVRKHLTETLMRIPRENLISCHTDGILIEGEVDCPPGWIEKKKRKVKSHWQVRHPGALSVDGKTIRLPGVPKHKRG